MIFNVENAIQENTYKRRYANIVTTPIFVQIGACRPQLNIKDPPTRQISVRISKAEMTCHLRSCKIVMVNEPFSE